MSTTKTGIQWTDRTWSPIRGCSRVSPGCDNCYAMKTGYRFAAPGLAYAGFVALRKGKPDWTGRVSMLDAKHLGAPLGWKKPARIFISTSDPFHRALSNEEIAALFGVAAACPQHTFQFLTKRADRLPEWFAWLSQQTSHRDRWIADVAEAEHVSGEAVGTRGAHLTRTETCAVLHFATEATNGRRRRLPYYVNKPWPLPNVHIGVSCEDQEYADERIPHLLEIPAVVRFVSAEPLLGPLNLSRYMPAWRCYDCRAFMLGRGDDGCDPDEGEADPCCSKCGSLRVSHIGLDWVIIGGESGNGARDCEVAAIESLITQCADAGVACFVKQLGKRPVFRSKLERLVFSFDRDAAAAYGAEQGRIYGPGVAELVARGGLKHPKGGDISEWAKHLRVRQFPFMKAS